MDLRFELRVSRWPNALRVLGSALILGASGWFLGHWLSSITAWLVALAIVASVLFFDLKRQGPKARRSNFMLLGDEAGCWFDAETALVGRENSRLPRLSQHRHFFGLHWLANTENQMLLLWPDQLGHEENRQVRAWIFRNARGAEKS